MAFRKTGTDLPCNLKMIFEGASPAYAHPFRLSQSCASGMEESGSDGLEAEIVKDSKGFLADVDAVCSTPSFGPTSRGKLTLTVHSLGQVRTLISYVRSDNLKLR